jgi:hypothetical protein
LSQSYRVTAAYQSAFPDPLCVRAGDLLVLGEEDGEYPGWIWATDPEDRSGWAPLDLAHPESGLARYDYGAGELDARVGEVLTCEQEHGGWALCTNAAGEKGWIPLANLEPAP